MMITRRIRPNHSIQFCVYLSMISRSTIKTALPTIGPLKVCSPPIRLTKTGSAESAIMMDADTDQTVIRNCLIQGDYSVACIEGDTTLSTEVLIIGNLLFNGSSDSIITQPAIDLLTGTTGYIVNNHIMCNVATVAAAMETCDAVMIFGNTYNEDVGATKADKPWNAGGVGGTLNSVSTSGDD